MTADLDVTALAEQVPRQSILVTNPRTGLPLQTPHSGRETFIRYAKRESDFLIRH
jgi:hypothetical protein